jgi:hypothetical protein
MFHIHLALMITKHKGWLYFSSHIFPYDKLMVNYHNTWTLKWFIHNYPQYSNKYHAQISHQTHFDMVRSHFQTNKVVA